MTTSNGPLPQVPSQLLPCPIDGDVRAGFSLLWQAHRYAEDACLSVWDFALEIDQLYGAGLTISDLRWLVAKGFAKHGCETSVFGDGHRSFRISDGLNFKNATCLVLTSKGAEFAKVVLTGSTETPQQNGACTLCEPHWDATRRQLSLGEVIVKRFRVPARNQEAILGAFQEESWPEQIDDPLPVNEDIDPHTRLHDAINRLNGHQENPLLRFHGNGKGNGVLWEFRNPH